tara:strand:- start:228 stop:905 length:678 start_codon:yes stop_codon:yes gene_type:complete
MEKIKDKIKSLITFLLSFKVKQIAKKINFKQKNIFIDLGTNQGQGFKYFSKYFKLEFFEYLLVEPNPNLKQDIQKLIEDSNYKEKIFFINKAAHVSNSKKELFGLVEDSRGIKSEGASILKEHNSKLYNSNLQQSTKIETFDLIEKLKELKNYDNIIIKMDVEGSEYDILEKLLYNLEDIKNIKHLFVEFHTRFFNKQERKKFLHRENIIKKEMRIKKLDYTSWI